MTNEFGITLGLSTIGLEKWCLRSRFNEVGSQEALHSSDHTCSPEPAWELHSQPRRAWTLHSKIPRNQPKNKCGASLVGQWLRIRLPMQCTRVRALVWEDPTCRGAAGPVSHNYWACVSGACAPQQGGHDSERPTHRDEEWPPLAATGESPRTKTKTQHSQK